MKESEIENVCCLTKVKKKRFFNEQKHFFNEQRTFLKKTFLTRNAHLKKNMKSFISKFKNVSGKKKIAI